jgi:hypothetical protein
VAPPRRVREPVTANKDTQSKKTIVSDLSGKTMILAGASRSPASGPLWSSPRRAPRWSPWRAPRQRSRRGPDRVPLAARGSAQAAASRQHGGRGQQRGRAAGSPLSCGYGGAKATRLRQRVAAGRPGSPGCDAPRTAEFVSEQIGEHRRAPLSALCSPRQNSGGSSPCLPPSSTESSGRCSPTWE